MRIAWLTVITALLAPLAVLAAEAGFTDYIIALKSNDPKSLQQARQDVEAAGGKVKLEIKSGLAALVVSLPNESITALEQKDYVDFMEPDQEVHTVQK